MVDAVRPETIGVRPARARRGPAGSSAGPGGTGPPGRTPCGIWR